MWIYPNETQDMFQITDIESIGIWANVKDPRIIISDHVLNGSNVTPPPTPPDKIPKDTTQPPTGYPPPTPSVPPPVTNPPPDPTVITPPPVPPTTIAWPVSGQVVLHVNMTQNQTKAWRLIWKSAMDPNKFGFVKVSEQPGSAVMSHQLILNNNGVKRFDSGLGDTAPTGNLCNFPSPGNASTVQMKYNDILDIIVINGANPTAAPSNILVDIGLPDRY